MTAPTKLRKAKAVTRWSVVDTNGILALDPNAMPHLFWTRKAAQTWCDFYRDHKPVDVRITPISTRKQRRVK